MHHDAAPDVVESDGAGGGADAAPPKLCDPTANDPAAKRAACTFKAGALPANTVACSGRSIPIDHIVLLMQENRSFDHYFEKLHGNGQDDVDVAPAGTTNPGPGDAGTIPLAHETRYCFDDTDHSWKASHEEWDNGKNDGFAIANAEANDPSGARAMGYFDQNDIPFYFQLASTFSISDHYFCALLGPTWPNRMYFYAATSFGLTSNTLPPAGATTIMDALNKANVSWKIYRSTTPAATMFVSMVTANINKIVDVSQFAADAAAGTLPAVSWIDPEFTSPDYGGETSEHPPADMQTGQHFVYEQIKALMNSPLWPHSAMFITYDEHGGIYDHVPPPPACPPDNIPPATDAQLGGFDRLGFRVPVFVISPYAKAHFVSHDVHTHTSILRFVEARFNLPALTARDANSDAMLDMFDFKSPPFVTPPTLTEPSIDQGKLNACLAEYPE
jgi:phospholipase C